MAEAVGRGPLIGYAERKAGRLDQLISGFLLRCYWLGGQSKRLKTNLPEN
jgi:hypothetical protein